MWLQSLLSPDRLTHIIDVGANPIDGDPPYKKLLTDGLCKVTGFEPHDEARAKLLSQASVLERYLPYALGDGGPATLHLCAYSGWTSLLKPSEKALSVFSQFQPNAKVLDEQAIQTYRLDELSDLDDFDMLKIDVQGSELSVFKGGVNRLKNAVVVHTEVSFVSLYENQPSWAEVDLFLRSQGFLPHCFAAVKHWPISPLQYAATAERPYRQLLEADVVYVKDFIDASRMSAEQLKQLCVLAFLVYGSVDLAGRCIELLVQRGELKSDAVNEFIGCLN